MNARGAAAPFTQLNALPTRYEAGIVDPVEKTVTAPVFLTLPRRSLIPGNIVIVYGVFSVGRAIRYFLL